jgi:hypothetical protein
VAADKCAFVRKRGTLTQRDVKNEGTSGDVYEKKGMNDTMPDDQRDFLAENTQISR